MTDVSNMGWVYNKSNDVATVLGKDVARIVLL